MKQSILTVFGNITSRFALRIISVLTIFFITASIQAQSLIPELSFKNPVLKTGKGCMGDGQDGAVYIFENVGWGVDALVTIQGRSSANVILSDPDINGPEDDAMLGQGFEDAWQPGIKYGDGAAPANTSWWMEFKISFVKHSDPDAPLSVNQFFVTGLDIHGDGNELHEFQTYYKLQSFTLERETAIFASSIIGSEMDPLLKGKRFDGPTTDYQGSGYSVQNAMVSNYYKASNSMVVRLGAVTGKEGSTAANRMYTLAFKSLAYDVPVTKQLPVNLVATNENTSINRKKKIL